MSIAGIILAAGFSKRLGRPKQELYLLGETLLERAVRTAAEAGLYPVFAVVRDAAWSIGRELPGATLLRNEAAEEGMASSVRLGVHALTKRAAMDGVVLMTCDQPLLQAEHLRALSAQRGQVTGSSYAGRVGVPAYFPAACFPDLLELQGDVGARVLLRDCFAIQDEALALDIDTEEDFLRAEQHFLLNVI